MLGGGEVHDNGGLVAVRIGVDASHRVIADLIVDEQFDAVARLVANARPHPNAVRVSKMLEHVFRSAWPTGLSSFLGFTLRVSAAYRNKVQSDERKRLLGISDHTVVLDARRDSNRIG